MPQNLVFPSLAQFRLIRCSGDSNLSGGRRELSLKFEPGISMELQERDNEPRLRALVSIDLKGLAFERDEGSPEASLDVGYAAEFRYPADVQLADVQDAFADHDYQQRLVLQVYPLAVLRFRDILSDMGLVAVTIPLTPP